VFLVTDQRVLLGGAPVERAALKVINGGARTLSGYYLYDKGIATAINKEYQRVTHHSYDS
jgi:hypothetical protein